MKSIVSISRYWDNPQIKTTISAVGISLQVELDDFIEALIQEIGPVTWTFTEKAFREKINVACNNTLEKLKEESIKAV
jgi:spore germination protein GerM